MSWVNFDPCIDSCHQLKQTSRKHLRSQNHLMFWLHKKFCLSLIKANIPENSSICAWPSNTTGEMESRRSLPMPAKPQSCLHVCLAEPSLCFSCQQLLSTECENQIRLKPRTWTYTSFPPDSLRQRTHNSWKLNYCEYLGITCSKVQSLAIGSVSSSRFSVQLIGAAAIPAVRQGTHSAKRPDSLHEHREYLEHAGEYWPQNAVKGNDRNSCHSFFDRSIAWYFDWYWLIFYFCEPLASQFV